MEFRIITFTEFREQMSTRLWPWEEPLWIPFKSNPYGIIDYYGEELFTRVLTFPIAASINGKDVGWTSIYNVSDTCVRIRGLYVQPEARGQHVAVRMLDYACSLWPDSVTHCMGLWREEAFRILHKYWGLEKVSNPQHWQPCDNEQHKVIFGVKKLSR